MDGLIPHKAKQINILVDPPIELRGLGSLGGFYFFFPPSNPLYLSILFGSTAITRQCREAFVTYLSMHAARLRMRYVLLPSCWGYSRWTTLVDADLWRKTQWCARTSSNQLMRPACANLLTPHSLLSLTLVA